MKIFFHSSDLDGKACGAVLTRKFPDATMISYNYFYEPERSINRIDEGEEAIFADITPTMENLRLAMEITDKITIIDHHSSSLDDLREAGLTFPGIQTEDGPGACLLVWQYYFPDKPVPFGIKCIAAYDNWDRTADSKRFHFGIQTFNTFPTNRIWDKIFTEDHNALQAILNTGTKVMSYIVPFYKRMIRSYAIFGTVDTLIIDGVQQPRYRAIMINQGAVDSSIFDDCESQYDIYLRVIFGKGWKWLVSITTNRDDIDVSAIAREFGGGGHRKSAGFATENLEDFFTPLLTSEDQAKFAELPVLDQVHP